jgi:hypothetical protein
MTDKIGIGIDTNFYKFIIGTENIENLQLPAKYRYRALKSYTDKTIAWRGW